MVLAFALTVVLSLFIAAFYGKGFKTMNAVWSVTKYGFVAVVCGVVGLVIGTFVHGPYAHPALACAGMGVLTSLVTMRRVMSR